MVPNELSPLHAKVLRYLGEDMSLKVDMSVPESELFMDTWSDLAPVSDSELVAPPVELKTIRLPTGEDGSEHERCVQSTVLAEPREEMAASTACEGLTGGLQINVEAGETLRNPFATMNLASQEEEMPIELRTLRRLDGRDHDNQNSRPATATCGDKSPHLQQPSPALTQTLRGCFTPVGGLTASDEEAMELHTIRRAEILEVTEGGGDVPIPVPMPPPPIQKGLLQEVKVPTQLDEELAVLESVTSLPGSMRTSLATETIPLDSVHATPGAEAAEAVAGAWESPGRQGMPVEAELSESAGKPRGGDAGEKEHLGHGQDCATDGDLDPEGQHQDLQETVLLEGETAEAGPSICQESHHSSPANSAVPSMGADGGRAAPAAPLSVLPMVLTPEDEAVTGLRRRGGVEVVVDSPKVNANARPPSGASAEAPMSGRRPPKAMRVATPNSKEDEKLILCGQKAGTPIRRSSSKGVPDSRRSCSLGRKPGALGMHSNRKLVRNALEHCLKGDANREQREQVLKSFDEELLEYERFIILFRSIHTGRHDLRALYGCSEGSWTRLVQLLPSPTSLEQRMVTQCLRYDSGGKEFKEVPASQETLSVADAVFLYPQYLQKSRGLL